MRRIVLAVLAFSVIQLQGCGKQVSAPAPAAEKVEAAKNVVVADRGTSIVAYIVSHMDEYDKAKLLYAFENAQPDVPYEWENQQAETSYSFTYFSEGSDNTKKCRMAEIYSGNKRLRACAVVRFDPEKGWIIKSQQ